MRVLVLCLLLTGCGAVDVAGDALDRVDTRIQDSQDKAQADLDAALLRKRDEFDAKLLWVLGQLPEAQTALMHALKIDYCPNKFILQCIDPNVNK